MDIKDSYKKSLKFLNKQIFSESDVRSLVISCCSSLLGQKNKNDISDLSGPNNQITAVHCSIIYVLNEFIRHNRSATELIQYLVNECEVDAMFAQMIAEQYDMHAKEIRAQFLNINCHLPHITDVKWKIDYMTNTDGLMFRVFLKTEIYDADGKPKIDYIDFSCSNEEFQDLIYKLKDALHHYYKLSKGQ